VPAPGDDTTPLASRRHGSNCENCRGLGQRDNYKQFLTVVDPSWRLAAISHFLLNMDCQEMEVVFKGGALCRCSSLPDRLQCQSGRKLRHTKGVDW